MTERFIPFPDAEAIAGYALRIAGIDGLGVRVYSSIPNTPTYPLATVRRLGGLPAVRQYLDAPRIEVQVWGGGRSDDPDTRVNKSVIHDIAQEARVVLMELEGESIHTPVDAFVSGVDDSQSVTWVPDTSTGRDRYLFAVVMYCRAIDPVVSS